MPELNEREQGYLDAIMSFGDETFILRYRKQASRENGRGMSHSYSLSPNAVDLEARTVRVTRKDNGKEETVYLNDITWIAPTGCIR